MSSMVVEFVLVAATAALTAWLVSRSAYRAQLREKRIAIATQAGEREAAALFLEYYEQDKLAAEIRAGAHLARLTRNGKELF